MLAAEAAQARARGHETLAHEILAARPAPLELGERAAESGNPVVPLVEALRSLCGPGVHRGATSQDILDTALMLVTRDALTVLRDDLGAAADAAAALAGAHRATPIIGRTLMQQAVPTTFGLKAAGWMRALDAARGRLDAYVPAAQLAGPAGTRDGLDDDAVRAYAGALGLEPAPPWHTDRTRIGELAGSLGVACGAIAKAAGDVVLLARRRDLRPRLRPPGAGARRHPAGLDGARARARRRRLARRVGAAAGAADRDRLRVVVAAFVPVRTRGRRGAHGRQPPRRRRRTGERHRARGRRALRATGGVARDERQLRWVGKGCTNVTT
jgi:3-carboxy-cis,cis-muconate cycloisomerase